MALSVEKLLTDAHTLIINLKDHDSLADKIINTSHMLLNKFEAMKQYQDDITELNEIAKHRPRSTLVLGIAQENRQIRELQQENRELQMTLEEYQSALELIMQKYREHTVKLLQSNKLERALQDREGGGKDSVSHLMDKIDEMAGVMQKAIEVDEKSGCLEKERLGRLELENRALREMLEICTTSKEKIIPAEQKEKDEKEESANESEDDDDDKTDTEEDSSIAVSHDLRVDEAATLNEEKEGKEAKELKVEGASVAKSPAGDTSTKEKEKEKAADDKKKKKSPDIPRKATTPTSTSKFAGASKSAGDVRKGRVTPTGKTEGATSGTAVKKTASSTTTKKDSASVLRKSPSTDVKKDSASTVRKSPSTEVKKDLKAKASPKTNTGAKK